MKNVSLVKQALQMAAPIMVGYIFLGIPCGILSQSVGMDALQVFLLSALFYSGAGQYMIPNMWLLGSPMAAIIASVTLVNSRQMLYSASLSRFCANVLGVLLGSLLTVPTALASFAMTSIFLCLLFSQPATKGNIAAGVVAVLGVYLAKCVGLSGPAILIGALLGVAAGMIVVRRERVSARGLD